MADPAIQLQPAGIATLLLPRFRNLVSTEEYMNGKWITTDTTGSVLVAITKMVE